MFLFQPPLTQQVVFLLMFPKEEVIYLDLTFEEASKFIVSAGTSNPKINFDLLLIRQLYQIILIINSYFLKLTLSIFYIFNIFFSNFK